MYLQLEKLNRLILLLMLPVLMRDRKEEMTSKINNWLSLQAMNLKICKQNRVKQKETSKDKFQNYHHFNNNRVLFLTSYLNQSKLPKLFQLKIPTTKLSQFQIYHNQQLTHMMKPNLQLISKPKLTEMNTTNLNHLQK